MIFDFTVSSSSRALPGCTIMKQEYTESQTVVSLQVTAPPKSARLGLSLHFACPSPQLAFVILQLAFWCLNGKS